MAVSPEQAISRAKAQADSGSTSWPGKCLAFVEWAYEVSPRYSTASEAYWGTKDRGTGQAPLGAPVWWTGGTEGFGHVALSCGDGTCYSNDFTSTGYAGDGRIRRIPISSIQYHDNPNAPLVYRGWSSDLADVEVLMDMTEAVAALEKHIDNRINALVAALCWGGTQDGAPWAGSDSWKRLVAENNDKAILSKIGSGAGGSLTQADVDAVLKARFSKAAS